MFTRSATPPAPASTASTAISTTTTTGRLMVVSSLEMADRGVTAEARERGAPVRLRVDGLHDGRVTVAARALGHVAVARGDLDRLGKAAGGEVERVPEPVEGFRPVLAGEARRRVAVVARGDRAVAARDPAVVLLAHDVAVHARARVVGQVRGALGVDERVATDAEREPDGHGDDERGRPDAGHRP